MASEFKLPKLTETADTVHVTKLLVAPGQTVAKDQALMEVNADKSNLEVYAPAAGKIVKFNVKEGDEVKVGIVYVVIEASGAAPVAPSQPVTTTQQKKEAATELPAPKPMTNTITTPRRAVIETAMEGVVYAGPGARYLARKLNVDLRNVKGSGQKGRITEDDVKVAFAGTGVAGMPGVVPTKPMPNFEKFGTVKREPLTHVRKLVAQQMSLAWTTIPHVTQHDLADVTELEAFRKAREGKGPKLTVTAFALKACAIALKQFPTFNASIDLSNGTLIYKQYYHIGVAVDTKSGLLVPVIRDVDKKGVEELAAELTETADKARSGKADMTGGTFTITNLGGIGGTAFTPIVNWPEVAILGMSRGRMEPVYKDGQFVPRLMLPLSLSYDHRVIDGADAARFTRRIAEMLENPWLMVLHG